MEVMTRAEAKAKGLSTYFTGKPCPKGHIAVRRLSGQCRDCRLEFSRQPDRVAAAKKYRLEYYASQSNKDKKLNWQRNKNGLPEPDRAEPAFCEICGKPPNGKYKRLALDHCHKTGKFRGWLCSACNWGLGIFGDDLEGISKAIEYLKKNDTDPGLLHQKPL